LRRARAAPSARFGFLIRVRQHALFQGRRCGQDTGPLEVGAEDAQRLKRGGDFLHKRQVKREVFAGLPVICRKSGIRYLLGMSGHRHQ
jgi:hypothetical protein